MLPQNGSQDMFSHRQQQSMPSSFLPSTPSNPGQESNPYFNLDASQAAKQMAALNAASLARMSNRSAPGGTSASFLGATSNTNFNVLAQQGDPQNDISTTPFNPQAPNHQPNIIPIFTNPAPDHSMSHPPTAPRPQNNQLQNQQNLQARRRGFLTSLATLHIQRNTPLPPALTGVQYPPNYDPGNSQWKSLECPDLGFVRLAGKDIDLFRLWGTVLQAGGLAKVRSHLLISLTVLYENSRHVSPPQVNQQNAWSSLLAHFDLPEHFPSQPAQPVVPVLTQLYITLLAPFDDQYRRNMMNQQQKAMLAAQQAQGPQTPARQVGQMPGPPGMNLQQPPGRPQQPGFPGQAGQIPNGTMPNMNMMGMGMMAQQPGAAVSNPIHIPPAPGAPQFPGAQPMPSQTPHPPSNGHGVPADARPPVLSSMPSSDSLTGGMSGMNPIHPVPQPNGASMVGGPSQSLDMSMSAELDGDAEGKKRKSRESEESDGKRARARTGGSEPPDSFTGLPQNAAAPFAATPMPPRVQPSRRKIEYVPFAREVETYGGRDLNHIEDELVRVSRGRPLRDINEWGNVDIEALTMSIRSRLAVELSYALTTFTLLSTMRGQTPTSGFPIFQCQDLLEETLDLLEDIAFDGVEEEEDFKVPNGDDHIVTHREIVNTVHDEGNQPFISLDKKQGSKGSERGPRQRPGDLILTIMNILRNLSIIPDNQQYLALQTRLFDLVLQVCRATYDKDGGLFDTIRPTSPVLSLADLIIVRKDALNILLNTAGTLQLSASKTPSSREMRNAARAFELMVSFLVDKVEAVTPMGCVMMSGVPLNGNLKPPTTADVALEVFTRLCQPDSNRRVISKSVPQDWLWLLLEALIHRLPLSDVDYQIAMRDQWLSYIEKTIMAIYSVTFMAPPVLKNKIKKNRTLAFGSVMLRVVKKFMLYSAPDVRVFFVVSARRAVEAMKLVDDGADAFDTGSSSAAPVMAFGMGYGEAGEARVELGTGLLGGHQDEVTWGILLQPQLDDVMFSELDSLARVG
ncbi:hypothetical protein JAAARDRAFT_29820 [Jaapia argillacea MUCL 33604]|uniref:ARID domain-containing protein n=1 Tax=Jaapia argillacea MUCL 33604 TaxID=933084 RepID=A0A067QC93_9AGAM|nr:hypothetical protein JAAARDRAFT_29820 [Jaapia argillacea MUCL 33604]